VNPLSEQQQQDVYFRAVGPPVSHIQQSLSKPKRTQHGDNPAALFFYPPSISPLSL
jgi:hypothetical protein